MLQKKRFGDDYAGTARSHDPDDRDDQVSHHDDPIAHAANNGRGRLRSQVYDLVADCGRIAIRYGQVRKLGMPCAARVIAEFPRASGLG